MADYPTIASGMLNYDGSCEVEHGGFAVRIFTVPDDTCGDAPWEREDGHGEVSDWVQANYAGYAPKAPGQKVLYRDRRSYLLYDYAGAIAKAKADGWGFEGDEGLTRGQRAAGAVERDFQRLKDWCGGDWYYMGVIAEVSKAGVKLGQASLWGIESDCGRDYLAEVANELVPEAMADARETIKALAA